MMLISLHFLLETSRKINDAILKSLKSTRSPKILSFWEVWLLEWVKFLNRRNNSEDKAALLEQRLERKTRE
jgi:hypothetical protein